MRTDIYLVGGKKKRFLWDKVFTILTEILKLKTITIHLLSCEFRTKG